MQPSADPSAANLIPAAHMPSAMSAAATSNNPGVLQQLKAMQAQLNALIGGEQQGNMPDAILVNSAGRLVEVDGKTAVELLSKPGFRKATPDEEARYRRAILRQTPQYLRRMEQKRLAEEAKILDELEAEDADDGISLEDLLTVPVTTAQASGTPAPAAAAPAITDAPANNTETATPAPNDSKQTTDENQGSTPKPPSRRKRTTPANNTETANS